MKLENTFEVPVPLAEAWPVLLDVARVAPCVPGAIVDEVEGDKIIGRVKVKLGPVALTYRGTVALLERDELNHRAVMQASAREARGNGNLAATITTALTDLGASTSVSVTTDLNITGKPAQFGRGMLEDVSTHLTAQFARALAAGLADGSLSAAARPLAPAEPAAGSAPTAADTPGATFSDIPSAPPRSAGAAGAVAAPAAEPEPLDLLGLVSPVRLPENAVQVAVAFVMGLLIGALFAGRRR